jgi:hypothetical protein
MVYVDKLVWKKLVLIKITLVCFFPAIDTATRTDLKNALTYLVPLKITKKKVFIALAPSPFNCPRI